MVQTIYLDENEHAVSVLRALKHEEDLCDFIIKVQDVEYRVHKNILSVGSPYFKAMLTHDTKESRDGKVEMKDVDAECVKSCINFLYSGNFDIPDGKIGQLLHAAITSQLDKVKEAISDILSKSLSAEVFHEIRSVAKMYELQTLSNKCKIYYQENLMAISSQPVFENEEKSHLINILKSRNLNLSEEEKLTVSLRWVGKNTDKKEDLFELIKLIKLKDVPSEYLGDMLEKHPFISNDFRLYKFINDAYVQKLKKTNSETTIESNDNKDLIILFDDNADCLQSFDPATDEVTKFQEKLKLMNRFFSAVSMDSYIYVLCANKSVHRLNFRNKLSIWERMRDIIDDHGMRPPVVSLSGSLFVIGAGFGGARNVVEVFDPIVNQWLRLKDKPKAVSGASLVSLNDSIFCIGGWDGRRNLNSLCKFTPSTSQWVVLEPMKTARENCGAVAVEQRIFVMGGWRDINRPNVIECYDIYLGQWTSWSPTMDIGWHDRCVAHYINGFIYLNLNSNKMGKYDVANDRWYKVKLNEQYKICASVLIK